MHPSAPSFLDDDSDEKITVDIGLNILRQLERLLHDDNILPLSENIRLELLHGVFVSSGDRETLTELSKTKLFPCMEIEGKTEKIIFFMNEYLSSEHALSSLLLELNSNLASKSKQTFYNEIVKITNNLRNYVGAFIDYKSFF